MATRMTLRKRLPRPPPSPERHSEEEDDHSPVRKMPKRGGIVKSRVHRRRSGRWSSRDSDFDSSSSEEEEEEEEVLEYEKIREQRMRENREKMEKLGIFGLSQQFKPAIVPRRAPPPRKPSVTRSFAAPYQRDRKSDRLKDVGRVNYFKDEGTLESMGISVPETWAPEVYTEEHEKLLGDCEKPWILYVDGYGEEGERLYDPLNGKMCHQCRQKTVGSFSICRKCKSAQGQLCGDCLYMRYGENVLEANENINWSCPSCREICNCSRCRRAKGWDPTVCAYQKVVDQGYKSIAHYLIKSRSAKNKPEDNSADADANVNPDMTAHSAPQMIYSDTSDGSTDDDPNGYNSDSSEEAKESQQPSVKVPDAKEAVALDASDEENEMSVAEDEQPSVKEVATQDASDEENEMSVAEDEQPSVEVSDDKEEGETLEVVDKENEMLGAEINNQPCETGGVCV